MTEPVMTLYRLSRAERGRYRSGEWIADAGPRCSVCGCLEENHDGACDVCSCDGYVRETA